MKEPNLDAQDLESFRLPLQTSYMFLKASFRVMARLTSQELGKEDDRGEKDTEEYLFRWCKKTNNAIRLEMMNEFPSQSAGKSFMFWLAEKKACWVVENSACSLLIGWKI